MKKLFNLAVAGLMLAASATAVAQDAYPTRPVRIVVPFGAGGITDATTRALAEGLQRELGQSFVIDNAPGASGMIGTAKIAQAAPDGYNLLFTTNVHVINPALRNKIPYDAAKDFTPLAIVGYAPNILVVSAESPLKTVKDYIAAAKADVGGVSYASAGIGTTPHLAAELFSQLTGTRYIHVPYNTTTAMAQAVLAGDVKSTWTPAQPAEQFLKTQKLRALGVASRQRSRYAPDVPTFEELGFKEFISETWFGLLGPANLPPAVSQKLIAATQKLMARPEFQERLKAVGMDRVQAVVGEDFRKLIPKDVEGYKALVKANNIPLVD